MLDKLHVLILCSPLTVAILLAGGCGNDSGPSQTKTPGSSAAESGSQGSSDISAAGIDSGKKMPLTGDCFGTKDSSICTVEQLIHKFTNDFRIEQRVGGFGFGPKMGCVSRLWSDEQAARQKISHDWMKERVTQKKFATDCSGSGSLFSENVSMGTYGVLDNMDVDELETIARDFVERWKGSDGHRKNLLGNYLNMGTGVAVTPDGAWYATQIMGSGD